MLRDVIENKKEKKEKYMNLVNMSETDKILPLCPFAKAVMEKEKSYGDVLVVR